MKLLHDAMEEFQAKVKKGTNCPCCGRFSKQYKRKLNSGMAQILIKIYKLFSNESVHLQNEFLHFKDIAIRNEYSKLKHWGLLEQGQLGYWRITDLGVQFVLGHIEIPRHIILFNNELLGFSGEKVTIQQALGDKFNYNELMNG